MNGQEEILLKYNSMEQLAELEVIYFHLYELNFELYKCELAQQCAKLS